VLEPEMVRIGPTLPVAPAANSLIVSILASKTLDVGRGVNGDRGGGYQPGVASPDLRLHGGR